MTQKSESRTNGPHVAAQMSPRNIADHGRWSDENQQREPSRQLEDEETNPIAGIVQHHPLSAVMAGFGFGLGFGLGLTLLLTRRQQTWFERHVPESIQHLPDRLMRVPNSLGSYVPSSWKQW
jgi:hypothetical protein